LKSDNAWEKLIVDNEFKKSIDTNGYFHWKSSFQDYIKKYNLNLRGNAPDYLSINFWSEQPSTLIHNGLYVIRLDAGSFVIFKEERFRKPYLDLKIDNAKEIPIKQISSHSHLQDAFNEHYNEDANLEHLRILGVYEEILDEVCGTKDYRVGPRGSKKSIFKIYFKDQLNQDTPISFDYEGQEELDYSIWTEKEVLVFEAKQNKSNSGGLDVGWHKLAFTSQRFLKIEDLSVIPVYYLRQNQIIYLFAFPKMPSFRDGIILNDESQFSKYKSFKVVLPV
jgi:hypothetical protein